MLIFRPTVHLPTLQDPVKLEATVLIDRRKDVQTQMAITRGGRRQRKFGLHRIRGLAFRTSSRAWRGLSDKCLIHHIVQSPGMVPDYPEEKGARRFN